MSYEAILRETLSLALTAITAERDREGKALTDACCEHAAVLRGLLPAMRQAADLRATAYRSAVVSRVSELLAGQPLDSDQLIRDVALYAERIDVTEELVRLAAHVDALDVLLTSQEEQVGRKLEFLLQEIGREINTTGAKSNDTALTNIVLEAKVVIDQLKEQSANVI
jgi:large subunit ribosomal protein L28